MPTIEIKLTESKELISFEEYKIAVLTEKDLDVASISLVMSYPDQMIEITQININDNNTGNLLYTAENGELRISWVCANEINLKKGEQLFIIKFAAGDITSMGGLNIPFVIKSYSEFGDGTGKVIENVKLSMPHLSAGLPSEYLLGQNYPNPFNNTTQIGYAIPEEGYVTLKVFNLLGEQIALLVRTWQRAGVYNVEFDCSGLDAGVYLYKIDVKGKTEDYVQTRRMIVTGR
jgi:hypothetical protein